MPSTALRNEVLVWQSLPLLRGVVILCEGVLLLSGGVVTALTIQDEYVSVIVTIALAAAGLGAWLLRLEGRVTVQAAINARVESVVDKMDKRMGEVIEKMREEIMAELRDIRHELKSKVDKE